MARAKIVWTSPKLRVEYDLLGLDLDDDKVGDKHQQHSDDSQESSSGGSTNPIGKESSNSDSSTKKPHDRLTMSDYVLSAFKSAALTSL